MTLWLDDVREPWKHGHIGAVWVKTYNEAVEVINKYKFDTISLDHDLAFEHYNPASWNEADYKEKTGYDFLCYIEEHNLWPPNKIRIHSMNPVGRQRMQQVIDRYYNNIRKMDHIGMN